MGSSVVGSTDPLKPRTILNVMAQLGSARKPENTFEATLAAAHTPSVTAPVAPAATAATTASTAMEEATPEAGTLAPSPTTKPLCPCQESGGLAVNISFFVRLSGDFERSGHEVQTLFHRAARLVSDIFRQEQGWVGDPIGQFLSVSETASAKGTTESSSFLTQLMSKAQSGLQEISQFLGASPLPQTTFGNTSTASSWFNPTYGKDLANLQLSSAATNSSSAPVRIPEYNRNGGKLYLISNDEAEQIRRDAQLGRVFSDSRDKSVRFIEAFNSFLDSFAAEEESTETSTADSNQDQIRDSLEVSPAQKDDHSSDSTEIV